MSRRPFHGLSPVPEGLGEDLTKFLMDVRRLAVDVAGGRLAHAVTAGAVNSDGTVSDGRGGAAQPDLTPPPTPTGLAVSAGISYLLIECAPEIYSQGRGHAETIVYGAQWPLGQATAPTFANAVKLTSAPAAPIAYATNPNTRWCIWMKWKSRDGVESTNPAGGVNGVQATTGQDVTQLLEVLTGQIRESQLFSALGSRINLIDAAASVPGSVNQRIASGDGALQAQYTVKVDINGYVAGFGLASTANNATPFSEFAIRADRFYVASPSGPGITPIVPFVVNTTTQTVNGVTVPPGVYLDAAFIRNGTIIGAKIAELTVDNAKLISVAAGKLTAGAIAVGQFIESTGYVAGSAGWRINGSGTAEFSGVIVRGTIFATAGQIGGNSIDASGLQSATYMANAAGWRLSSDGTGQIGGFVVGGDHIRSANYSAGSAGWRLSRDGQIGMHGTAALITGGAMTGYNWPAAGQNGFYIGPQGLLMGNANGGRYFDFNLAQGQINTNMTLHGADGWFSGVLSAQAINAVNTLNIAGEAVTVPRSVFAAAAHDLLATHGGWHSTVGVWAPVAAGQNQFVVGMAEVHALSVNMSGGNLWGVVVRVLRGGIQVFHQEYYAAQYSDPSLISGPTAIPIVINLSFTDNPPASGEYLYDLQIHTRHNPVRLTNRSLAIIGVKR